MTVTFSHPELPAATAVDALQRAGFELDPPRPAMRVVLDTFDGRLFALGLRLEHHTDPEPALVLRDRSGAPPARLAGVAAPRWPSGLPSGPLRSRLTAATQERALVPHLTVRSDANRAHRRDRRGKVIVLAELHDGVDVVGTGPLGWYLEVERAIGHPDEFERVVAELTSSGFVAAADDLVSVVAGRCGTSLAGTSSSPTVPLDAREPALQGYCRVLANLADAIEVNRLGAIEETDAEFLHDLRVAVRRTRSVLKAGKGVLPEAERARYRDAFGTAGQQSGSARDLDVYVLGWDDEVAPLALAGDAGLAKVRQEIERRRTAAHRELAKMLSSDEFRQLLDGWQAWLADQGADGSSGKPLGPVVARRIEQAQETLLTKGRAIDPASPGEHLHDLRKEAKRLRYLVECFGSLFPNEERKAFVSQMKDLQENLGAFQDAEVQLAHLRELAHDLHTRAVVDTDALLAMGRLSELLERRRADERASFAQRFARYDRKANRKALATLLDGIRKP